MEMNSCVVCLVVAVVSLREFNFVDLRGMFYSYLEGLKMIKTNH